MTAYKLNQPGILALEKAMWMARISSVISEIPQSTPQITRVLNDESIRRGVRCISDSTISVYLKEMRDRGMLESDRRTTPGYKNTRFYWKVKKIGSD